MAYICDVSYRNEVNHSFKQVVRDDGLVDSVTGLLCNYNDDNRILLNMLLRTF